MTDRELEEALLEREARVSMALALREREESEARDRECRERQKAAFVEELQRAVEAAQDLIDQLTVAIAAVGLIV